ncbi:hypothetical protein T492DRAFT_210242 [Pavlovales sp. CCMP2436]|nr:hypothetical protein T492DRAFT_210242 [Pavlovales sp. CCMP2436]
MSSMCALCVGLLSWLDYRARLRRLARAIVAQKAHLAPVDPTTLFDALFDSRLTMKVAGLCAVQIQRHARGLAERRRLGAISGLDPDDALGQPAGKKGFSWRDLPAQLREHILKDHSLLGLYFTDGEESGELLFYRNYTSIHLYICNYSVYNFTSNLYNHIINSQGRAELAQRFFLVIMLALLIELLLYAPAVASSFTTTSQPWPWQISVVSVAANSVITACSVVPLLLLTGLVFTWGYSRPSPLGDRIVGWLLGRDAEHADEALVKASGALAKRRPRAMMSSGDNLEEDGAGGAPAAEEKRRPRADTEEGGAGGGAAADKRPPPHSPHPRRPPWTGTWEGTWTETRSPHLRHPLPQCKALVLPPLASECSTTDTQVSALPAARARLASEFSTTDSQMSAPPTSRASESSTVNTERSAPFDLSSVPHNLSSEVIRGLRAKFAKYDKNDSGFVSISELGVLMHDMGFTLSRRRRLAALSRELGGGGEREGITLTALVLWYDGMVQKAIIRIRDRKLERQSGWNKHAAALGRSAGLPPLVRIALAWLLAWAVFVALALLAVVYARELGPINTQLALGSWGIAQAQCFSLQEPILITVLVLLPALLDKLAAGDLAGELLASGLSAAITRL